MTDPEAMTAAGWHAEKAADSSRHLSGASASAAEMATARALASIALSLHAIAAGGVTPLAPRPQPAPGGYDPRFAVPLDVVTHGPDSGAVPCVWIYCPDSPGDTMPWRYFAADGEAGWVGADDLPEDAVLVSRQGRPVSAS